MCQSSYLCSTNLAKAAPSPAPTTAVPTISAAPTMDVCSSVGEFEYEGRTLYCVEAEGEIHNVLRVEGGHSTCRHTDENSCPDGFDIWVPRSYAHALAVLEATGGQDLQHHHFLVGIYRDEDGCGSCGDYAMNSDAMADYDGVGWRSVAGDPWSVSYTHLTLPTT